MEMWLIPKMDKSKNPGWIDSDLSPFVGSQDYLSGITIGAGATGASAGRILQEVREKPARAAIRPRMVAIFIFFIFI